MVVLVFISSVPSLSNFLSNQIFRTIGNWTESINKNVIYCSLESVLAEWIVVAISTNFLSLWIFELKLNLSRLKLNIHKTSKLFPECFMYVQFSVLCPWDLEECFIFYFLHIVLELQFMHLMVCQRSYQQHIILWGLIQRKSSCI